MWAKHKQQSGFTIVELLIVIVVIAILAAISIVAYNGIQQRARDTERMSELTSLQKALELYHADNDAYPLCGATGPNSTNALGSGAVTSCLTDDLVPKYIQSIPTDPINSSSYIYRYGTGYKKNSAISYSTNTSDNYILGVKQESSSGPYYGGWGATDLTLLLGSSN